MQCDLLYRTRAISGALYLSLYHTVFLLKQQSLSLQDPLAFDIVIVKRWQCHTRTAISTVCRGYPGDLLEKGEVI